MSGARPDGEAARRGGLVPFTGSSNGRNNNGGSATNASGYPNTTSNKSGNNGSVTNYSGYPNISSNKSGNFAGNAAPENVKASNKIGNDQLWSNGSGAQGSAPVWPENQPGNQQQGAPTGPGTPVNPSNNRQTAAAAGPGGGAGYIQGPQRGVNGGSQPQQQQQNWQGRNVQQGVPVNFGNNGQNNEAGGGNPQGAPQQGGSGKGFITQGPQMGPVPKGDYVYYDGNGNQIPPPPGASPQGTNGSGHWTGSGSDRHFHHHYYYQQQQQQQQPQQPQVGYPYDKKMEEKKKRKPGAKALAAALIACWACTCCCHAPCGW